MIELMGQQDKRLKSRMRRIFLGFSKESRIRRAWVIGLLCLLCLGKVSAVWSAIQDPKSMLNDIVSTVMSILQQKKEVMKKDSQQLNRVIQTHVIPYVDFEEMSRLASEYPLTSA